MSLDSDQESTIVPGHTVFFRFFVRADVRFSVLCGEALKSFCGLRCSGDR